VSANDIWAVGYSSILHWDGTSWAVVPSPNVGILFGVAAVSANDVWAVGYYHRSGIAQALTLVEHWDGSRWSVVPSPNVDTTDNILFGVAAVSANDVWAVGDYADG